MRSVHPVTLNYRKFPKGKDHFYCYTFLAGVSSTQWYYGRQWATISNRKPRALTSPQNSARFPKLNPNFNLIVNLLHSMEGCDKDRSCETPSHANFVQNFTSASRTSSPVCDCESPRPEPRKLLASAQVYQKLAKERHLKLKSRADLGMNGDHYVGSSS